MVEIRAIINQVEFEQACDLWEAVFPEDRDFFRDRLVYDEAYEWKTTYLAIVDGELAAAVQLFPFRMRWGSVELKAGGIGNVATLPEFRGMGLAGQMLNRLNRDMESEGFDLSLLMADLHAFYEKYGWHLVPDRELRIDTDLLKPLFIGPSYTVRKFEEADLEAVSGMYENNGTDSVGPFIRTPAYWQGQSNWGAYRPDRFLVAEKEGRIAAFMRYRITEDRQFRLADSGYQTGEGEAAVSLLYHALERENGVREVRAGLPAGHSLEAYLLGQGALYETDRGKMWRSFSLAGTLGKMAPELVRRLQLQSGKDELRLPVDLLLSVDGDKIRLHLTNDSLEVLPPDEILHYNVHYELGGAEWVTLLLKGFTGSAAAERAGDPYLRALFPDRPYVFWKADHF